MPRKTGTEVSTFPEPEVTDVHVITEANVNIEGSFTQLKDTLEGQGKELKRIRIGHELFSWDEEVPPIE